MLEVRSLSAGYGARQVLSELNAAFPGGSVCALTGPNGSGKSTLLKALAGILPAGGEVLLDGKPLTGLPPRELARYAAYQPQNRPVPEITALNLVLHGRFPYLSYPRRYSREDLRLARQAMEALGIGDLAERPLPALSGGQRQEVYLAMALAQDTRVLLLDEPTAFLDIGHQLHLMKLLRSLAASGKTVVAVLHDLNLALEQTDHVTVLSRGSICYQGPPEGAAPALEQTFAVRVQSLDTPAGPRHFFQENP